MQNKITLLHIYTIIPKAIFHSHKLNLSSENPRQSLISELILYQLTSLESLVKRSPPRRKSSIRYNFPSVWNAALKKDKDVGSLNQDKIPNK